MAEIVNSPVDWVLGKFTVLSRRCASCSGNSEARTYNLDGSGRVNLTPALQSAELPAKASINSAKTKILYLADNDYYGLEELFTVGTNGSAKTKVSVLADGEAILAHNMTSGGDKAVYRAGTTTLSNIYGVNLNGSNHTKLNADLVAGGTITSYALAGANKVVYMGDQDTNNIDELYSVNTDGTSRVKLNAALGATSDVFAYSVSVDGTKVVFTADMDTDNVQELYSVDVVGGAPPTKLNAALVANGGVPILARTQAKWPTYQMKLPMRFTNFGWLIATAQVVQK